MAGSCVCGNEQSGNFSDWLRTSYFSGRTLLRGISSLFSYPVLAESIPVAERSKARICSRSPAGIAGSNPAGDVDVCVVCVGQ